MSEFKSYAELATRCMADIAAACHIDGDSARNAEMRAHITVPELVSCCWAVCGPVWDDGASNDPNNLWPGIFQHAADLAAIFRTPSMRFVNDFESIGHALAALKGGGSKASHPSEWRELYAAQAKGLEGVAACMGPNHPQINNQTTINNTNPLLLLLHEDLC